MTEFGHFGSISDGICLDAWGAGPFEIVVGGKLYTFEDSDRFGPLILNKSGEPLSKQPGKRHPFWAAHLAWVKQGRQTDEDRKTCLWTPLKPTTFFRLGRKLSIVVEHGDEDGGYVEVPRPRGFKP